ncbi:MAG: iron chelate uptake ABC transporter family permease subunit [Candidatus Omnitrophota bacterium]|nr:iron chelate uptake ABC transporter family permease subunit [Candidatus Omnitrophota bacterium]
MTEFLHLMAAPFAACLVLTGIHAYLGLHVIERQVIFVDLALAQIAALGSTVAFLFGFGLHHNANYLFALGFTFLGAAVFALTRFKEEKVPHEAIIGVVYAVAAAASILVLSRASEGSEELKGLLVGHLLFVTWPEVAKMAVIYSLIGFLHWLFRRRLLFISQHPREAFDQGVPVRWWDLFFYITFGVVVTSSVELAGVLLVFSFLIVPAICGVLLGKTVGGRLGVGWGIGVLTSVLGITASYFWDLPTGAAVVCAFGFVLLAVGALRAVIK